MKFINIIKGLFKFGMGYSVSVIDSKEDQNFTNYMMRGNFVKITDGYIGSGGNIDISSDAYISIVDDIYIYGLVVKCNVKEGLNLLSQKTITLIVDNKVIDLDLNEDYYSIDELSNFGEKYYIEVDRILVEKEIIQLIADSQNIEFIVRGEKQTIKGYFSKKNINRFRDFYYDYLPSK